MKSSRTVMEWGPSGFEGSEVLCPAGKFIGDLRQALRQHHDPLTQRAD